MNRPKPQRTVIVTGDVTIDWNIACRQPGEVFPDSWTSEPATNIDSQPGGAALLAELVAAVTDQLREQAISNDEVLRPQIPVGAIPPDDSRFHHSFAMWSRDAKGIWRVSGFLGLDRADETAEASASNWQRLGDATSPLGLIILDDADLGFRHNRSPWPRQLTESGERPWIILKIARPVAQGELWDELLTRCAERLIVIMTIDDLRRTDVQISRRLSWERTAQDILWELTHNPQVNGLSRCAHTIVSFGTAGSIHLARGLEGALTADLCYDPEVIEGSWENGGHGSGHIIGNTLTLTAAIARQVLCDGDAPDIRTGIDNGVASMRKLYHIGYGQDDGHSPRAPLRFPVAEVVEVLLKNDGKLSSVAIQDPVRRLADASRGKSIPLASGFWTILEDRYPEGFDHVAEQIVLEGLRAALRDVPMCKIGKLTTVDRKEIESLRSIQSLIGEYCREKQKRPLSVAVFGPPGSGKSFGVEQVADSVCPGEIKTLTFNLSQFAHADELLGALHQVRDVALSGKTPLVFWDEFDTTLNQQPLGWLRYFLAPMQDGTFQEGQITHPIGKCIFVFAGGTSSRMENFGSGLPSDDKRKEAKVPDFISRLKGFLNVLGPNRQISSDGADPYYIIRRAILLRSLFERNAKAMFVNENGGQRLNIDAGVLRAMLLTHEYKHGIRSMESIIAMSTLSGKTRFERSSLPAESQLDLHVHGEEFLSIVQQIVLTPELTEHLAAAAHDIYCTGKKRDGWKFGLEKCETKKTHPWLIPYNELPEIAKDANRITVRSIPRKLAAAGYVMIPARSNEPALTFPGDDLEKLAEFEHQLWMESKLAAGFTRGKPTPENPKQNEYLVPWDDVSDEIKQIDRDLVKGIPEILEKAGYAVTKLSETKRE